MGQMNSDVGLHFGDAPDDPVLKEETLCRRKAEMHGSRVAFRMQAPRKSASAAQGGDMHLASEQRDRTRKDKGGSLPSYLRGFSDASRSGEADSRKEESCTAGRRRLSTALERGGCTAACGWRKRRKGGVARCRRRPRLRQIIVEDSVALQPELFDLRSINSVTMFNPVHGKDHKAPRAAPFVFSSCTLRDFARTHRAHAGASYRHICTKSAVRHSQLEPSSCTLRDFARTHRAHAGASYGGIIAQFRPQKYYLNLDIRPKIRHIWHTIGGWTLTARTSLAHVVSETLVGWISPAQDRLVGASASDSGQLCDQTSPPTTSTSDDFCVFPTPMRAACAQVWLVPTSTRALRPLERAVAAR
eukprot:scaffold35254_cov63-Phaeocystis_antarctica.AAC.9